MNMHNDNTYAQGRKQYSIKWGWAHRLEIISITLYVVITRKSGGIASQKFRLNLSI